jgi:hypothetical protein
MDIKLIQPIYFEIKETNKIVRNNMQRISIITILLLLCVSTLKGQYVFPSGGEDGYDWRVGTTQVISWSKYFMDTTKTIDIYLWNADVATYSLIATEVPVLDEYYLWEIPTEQTLGEHFKVKIIYSNNFLPKFKYVSSDFFSIKKALLQYFSVNNNVIRKIKNNHFTMYPNPASSELSIESGNKFFGIEIYDLEGSIVLYRRFGYTNNYLLDLRGVNKLSSSTYNVQVRFMGEVVTKQLVIGN